MACTSGARIMPLKRARPAAGTEKIIGVSCYNELERAGDRSAPGRFRRLRQFFPRAPNLRRCMPRLTCCVRRNSACAYRSLPSAASRRRMAPRSSVPARRTGGDRACLFNQPDVRAAAAFRATVSGKLRANYMLAICMTRTGEAGILRRANYRFQSCRACSTCGCGCTPRARESDRRQTAQKRRILSRPSAGRARLRRRGVVEAVGSAVTRFRAGDEVYFFQGGITAPTPYTPSTTSCTKHIWRTNPKNLSFTEGRSGVARADHRLGGALRARATQAGERVLIHAAAGGTSAISPCSTAKLRRGAGRRHGQRRGQGRLRQKSGGRQDHRL